MQIPASTSTALPGQGQRGDEKDVGGEVITNPRRAMQVGDFSLAHVELAHRS
jgi:hypothetical protein